MTRYHVHLIPGPNDANDPKVVRGDPVLIVLVNATDDAEAQELAWHFASGAVTWDTQEIEEAP